MINTKGYNGLMLLRLPYLLGFFLVIVYGCPLSGNAENEVSFERAQPLLSAEPSSKSIPQENLSSVDMAKVWREPQSGMEFVWVDGGCYRMGCGAWEDTECRTREQPEHEVCVNGFWIGRFEVTQGEWKKFMGANPASHKISDRHPVDRISWYDVLDLIEKLNSRKYGLHFRLPTEAEWEFAARGRGRPESFSGGKQAGNSAWYVNNSGEVSHTVGTKGANSLGIHDMSGNVREWVEDWYDPGYYQTSPSLNPQGPHSGTMKVTRGGSWNCSSHSVRTTNRAWNDPSVRIAGYGIRLVAVSFP